MFRFRSSIFTFLSSFVSYAGARTWLSKLTSFAIPSHVLAPVLWRSLRECCFATVFHSAPSSPRFQTVAKQFCSSSTRQTSLARSSVRGSGAPLRGFPGSGPSAPPLYFGHKTRLASSPRLFRTCLRHAGLRPGSLREQGNEVRLNGQEFAEQARLNQGH